MIYVQECGCPVEYHTDVLYQQQYAEGSRKSQAGCFNGLAVSTISARQLDTQHPPVRADLLQRKDDFHKQSVQEDEEQR